MSRRPVSVVVNTVDRAASLRRTLESLSQLDYPCFEVVVVNGPSTDGTEEVLADYAGRIKVGRCPDRNLSASRNIGIALSAGEIVAFIDDDAYADPAWLDRLSEAYDDEEVAGAGGPVYDHTGAELQVRYSYASRFGDAWVEAVEVKPDLMPYLSFPLSQIVPNPIGTNSSFRRDRLLEIGGFDEEFEFYLDETDVSCRLVDRGYVIRALDDGFVYHKFLASQIRDDDRVVTSRFSVVKNSTYFALKHGLEVASFAEVCRQLVETISRQRSFVDAEIGRGAADELHRERFERDVGEASTLGLERYMSGSERTRPRAWFDERTEPFLPYPRRIPLDGARLHLCYLTTEYPPGPVNGIGRVVHELATGAAAAGHVVKVVTPSAAHATVDLEAGVWVHRVPVSSHPQPSELDMPSHLWEASASLVEEVWRIHRHRPIDVLQSPNWDSPGIAALLAETPWANVVHLYTSLATVAAVDARLDSYADTQRMWAVERRGYELADALSACSRVSLADVERRYGLDFSERVVGFVPHGLSDLAAGAPPVARDPLEVLFVGRLEPRKGIDVLLDAVPAVLAAVPGAHFTVAGADGPAPDGLGTVTDCFTASAPPSIAERVRFLGRVDDADVSTLYARGGVFVAPSRFESFGLIAVEAMIFGSPVVVAAAGGMAELVEPGVTGLVVPPGNVAALAEAIVSLLSDPARARRMGLAGRRRYEQHYTADRMVEASISFYRSLPVVGSATTLSSRSTLGPTCS